MSRAYQIRVRESISEHVHVEDGVCSDIEILDILPQDAMRDILARTLAERGFEREGDKMRRDDDGIKVEVDLEKGTIAAKLASEKEVDLSIDRSRTVQEETATRDEANMRDQARGELKKGVDAEREKLTEEVATRLEGHLIGLRREVDSVVNKVTAEALKAKAASMGEITEVSENNETGELTIKVKV